MASIHSMTGHLFNRNISGKELDKAESLLSKLNVPNLQVLGVWTITPKQEKTLNKLNALSKKMVNYRGLNLKKRERIIKLDGDITFLNNNKLYKKAFAIPRPSISSEPRLTPTPKQSFEPRLTPTPKQSFEPRLTPTPKQSFEPRLTPTPKQSFEPRLTPTPKQSFEPQSAPQAAQIKAPTPTPQKAVQAVKTTSLSQAAQHSKTPATHRSKPLKKATDFLTELKNELNEKEEQYAFMKDQSKSSSRGWNGFEKQGPKLKQEIKALKRQLAEYDYVPTSSLHISRPTKITGTNTLQKKKIEDLHVKIKDKKYDIELLKYQANDADWKEESRLKTEIKKRKLELFSLEQELNEL